MRHAVTYYISVASLSCVRVSVHVRASVCVCGGGRVRARNYSTGTAIIFCLLDENIA